MLPFLEGPAANASSAQHGPGRRAGSAIEVARRQVAGLVGAAPDEIVFTSGATEANNLALFGLLSGFGQPGHIISCATEHPSVLEPLAALAGQGWEISFLPVSAQAELDLDDLEEAIRPDTALISLMLANNELGTVHPIDHVSAIARTHQIVVHTDAVQAAASVRVDVNELDVDLLTLSGHKLYGPQGVGALYVRRNLRRRLNPWLLGGGQEGGLRSGTYNTAGVVGFGAAAALIDKAEAGRLGELRERLATEITTYCPDVVINGPDVNRRVPGALHVTFPGADADAVMANCQEVAMASGSACASAAPGASHVLEATGMSIRDAECSLRMAVGRYTTEAEVSEAAAAIGEAVRRVRAITAPSEPSAGMAAA